MQKEVSWVYLLVRELCIIKMTPAANQPQIRGHAACPHGIPMRQRRDGIRLLSLKNKLKHRAKRDPPGHHTAPQPQVSNSTVWYQT